MPEWLDDRTYTVGRYQSACPLDPPLVMVRKDEWERLRALDAKVREHILSDRAHAHCPLRADLEGGDA